MSKLRLGAIQQLCHWLRRYKGGISRVVDMTICLQNPNWNPAHFFGSEHFFWIPNWKSKTPFLESKMESNLFLESEIESSKLSLESKTETVGIQKEIQHFFFKSKLESDSKFLESDDTFGNRKYNPLLFKESDFISTTLDMKKVANGDRGRRFTNDDSQL